MTNNCLLTHKMDVQFHVLCASMVNWVCREIDCRDIVAKDDTCLVHSNMKFLEEVPHPAALGSGIGHATVFSLGAGP